MFCWVLYGAYQYKNVFRAHATRKAEKKKRKKKKEVARSLTRKATRKEGNLRRLRKTLVIASLDPNKDVDRIQADANAVLARASPSEQGALKTDRLIGWFTLYFDIPTSTLLPFMVENVWPESLRIPFHRVGSVLYVGGNISLPQLRLAFSWFSLFLLFMLEFASIVKIKSYKFRRYRAIMSRLFYGAMYTVVVYQIGTLLGQYKSCTPGFGDLFAKPCKFVKDAQNTTMVSNQTGTIRVAETSFDIPTLILCVVVAVWAFRGSIRYTLYEKNSSSPSFMWMPEYEAIRYTVKTFITGASSLFKSYKFVTMTTCFIGFSLLLILTYEYQPCQGQGRLANNLRATGFALGSYLSLIGLMIITANIAEKIESLTAVLCSYMVLIVGASLAAAVTWKLNDKRAKVVAIPDARWHELLSSEHSMYAQKVAADAVLLHAEQTHGKTDVGDELLLMLADAFKRHESDGINGADAYFIRLRVAASYLALSAGQVKFDPSRVHTAKHSKGISKEILADVAVKSVSHTFLRFVGMLMTKKRKEKLFGNESSISSRIQSGYKLRKKKTERGRFMRKSSGLMKTADVRECEALVIDALVGSGVKDEVKSRVSLGLLQAAALQDEHSYYKLDVENPRFLHALSIAHYYHIQGQNAIDAIRGSIAWLVHYNVKLQHEYELSESGDPGRFLMYYLDFPEGSTVNTQGVQHGGIIESCHVNIFLGCIEQAFSIMLSDTAKVSFEDSARNIKHKVLPENYEKVDDNILESLFVLTDHAFSLSKGASLIEAQMLGLSGLGSEMLSVLRYVSPFLFSSSFSRSAAALTIVSRIKDELGLSWSIVSGHGETFGHAAKLLQQCKLQIKCLVEKIANLKSERGRVTRIPRMLTGLNSPAIQLQTGEVVSVNADYDGKSDIESLACILSLKEHAKATAVTDPHFIWEHALVQHLTTYALNLIQDCCKGLSDFYMARLDNAWSQIRADKTCTSYPPPIEFSDATLTWETESLDVLENLTMCVDETKIYFSTLCSRSMPSNDSYR